MRHFIHGQSGDLLVMEDGRALIVGVLSGIWSRFRWDNRVMVFLPTGTSIGTFDFRMQGGAQQFINAWNSNPASFQYGVLSRVQNFPLYPFALQMRSTVTPQLEVVVSPYSPNTLVINSKRLIVNGKRILINNP